MKFDQIELRHLKKAAEDFDKNGMPPTFGAASTYDAFFEGRAYPPKALIAIAQQHVSGTLPTSNEFSGGEKTECFKTLEKLGVEIRAKGGRSMYELLIEFLQQAQTNDLKWGKFTKEFQGLSTKASFGQGKPAFIPWLGIRDNAFQKERGTDCVFLYFKEKQHLILAYAHWESVDSKKWAWPGSIIDSRQSVAEYFQDRFKEEPFRYHDSHVFKSYWVNLDDSKISLLGDHGEEVSEDGVNLHVAQIVEEYKAVIEAGKFRSSVGSEILQQYLEWYKELIDPESPFDPIKQERKSAEGYKWKAFQCFQNNWNDSHTGQNIRDLISTSFADGNNLLRGPHYFPVSMLEGFSEIAPERTSQMFQGLYDHQEPIHTRILRFMEDADKLLELAQDNWNGKKPLKHYQEKRPIAAYLSMRFPETYFLFKKRMITDFCDNTLFWPKDKLGRIKSRDLSDLLEFFKLCEEVKAIIANDPELHALNRARLKTENIEEISFDDTNLLTQDFIYSVTEYLTPKPKDDKELIDILRKFGSDDCLQIISLIKRSLNDLGVNPNDERIAFSMPKNGSFLGLNIGQWRALGIDRREGNKRYVLFDSCEESDEKWRLVYYDSMEELIANHSIFLEFAKQYLAKVTKSGHHDDAPQSLVRAFNDDGYLKVILLKAFNDQYYGSFNQTISNDGSLPKPQDSMTSFDLNQIFFGPPGTGKTFNTINAALEIVDPEFFNANKDDRSALVQRFKELQLTKSNPDGQIAFSTFHQSLSYEDFIEGIKPDVNSTDESSLAYRIEDGIFKRLCSVAENNINDDLPEVREQIISMDQFNSRNFWKMSLGESADDIEAEIYRYCVNHNCIATGWGDGLDCTGLSRNEIDEKFDGMAKFHAMAMKRFVVRMQIGDFVLISNGNKSIRALGEVIGDYEYLGESPLINHDGYNHFRQIRWLFHSSDIPVKLAYRRQFMMQSIYGLEKSALKQQFFVGGRFEPPVSKKYALVIDEINRGNVSSIFGELITLIEKDKRQGQENELQATLPYSKESFSVPSNVHIIGTMNTADRSVDALDSALRRRFSFKEMPPQPDLIRSVGKLKESKGCLSDGTDLCKILEAINSRLLVLLDKDHLIGHSYFLNATSSKDVENLFEDKVLPLLEEYFFGDFGKIGLVLGESFVAMTSRNTTLLGSGYEILREDLERREDFELQKKAGWDFQAIYKQ